ncbi:Glycosyl transferases group 1 [Bifidobacterium goeldii]|uniref:Glycosyl transferases group 1 n=1 Tax=Bifidobacterium goeldii TaxID=2306975 RepID=A0A430FLM2_9BIFI|nr:glycosyltransferase [Bifidobacterium goeldii]RSX53680.1 Glycosyl transferases group 1 [Bifidobacterium goeldii]
MKPRVLAFGTYNVRKHPRVGILIDGLRANGCTVEEINHPLTLSTAQRVEILKKLWKLFGFAWNLLGLWRALRRDARAWMRANGRPDAVLVGYMGHFDVLLARHVFRHVPIALDHLIFAGDTAKDRGARGLKVRLLNQLDRMALGACDLAIMDTEEHRAMLPSGVNGMVIPVGAPDEWYAAGEAAEKTASSSREGIVFYGLYTPLQGAPVIAQAVRELADRGITPPVTLIGSGQDFEQVRSIVDGLSNVTLIPWMEPEQLPAEVARHAISLGIFSTTPKGLHVVPNKVYQAMAAGCAVITSDTALQRRMLGDGVVYVKPGDAHALANAIEHLLSDAQALHAAQQHALATAQRFTAPQVAESLATWVQNRKRAYITESEQ